MTIDEQNLILHTMKALADSQRREGKYRNDMLDMLCKELGVNVPERRKEERRDKVEAIPLRRSFL